MANICIGRKTKVSPTVWPGKTGYHLMGLKHYALWLHPPSLYQI